MLKSDLGKQGETAVRLPALDGLRGIAILLVLIVHIRSMFPAPQGLIQKILFGLAGRGLAGVDLFFVLSGFLITRILLSTKERPGYFRNFYGRRVLRIFPLYYATLIIVFFLLPKSWTSDGFNQLWYWLYAVNIAQSIWPNVTGGPGHFWSLAVEEQFYMVWPFIVFFTGINRLIVIASLLLPIALVVRVALTLNGFGAFQFTLARMDCLAAGALIAALLYRGMSITSLRRVAVWLAVAAVAVIIVGYPLSRRFDYVMIDNIFWFGPMCLLCASVLVFTLASNPGDYLNTVLSNRVLGFFGKYSYCLYIVHPFVFYAIQTHTPKQPTGSRIAIEALSAIGISLLIAWLSWHLFEKRFLRLKRYFSVNT